MPPGTYSISPGMGAHHHLDYHNTHVHERSNDAERTEVLLNHGHLIGGGHARRQENGDDAAGRVRPNGPRRQRQSENHHQPRSRDRGQPLPPAVRGRLFDGAIRISLGYRILIVRIGSDQNRPLIHTREPPQSPTAPSLLTRLASDVKPFLHSRGLHLLRGGILLFVGHSGSTICSWHPNFNILKSCLWPSGFSWSRICGIVSLERKERTCRFRNGRRRNSNVADRNICATRNRPNRGPRSRGRSLRRKAKEPYFLPAARQDMADAFAWYEQQSLGLGLEFLRCVEATVVSIQRHPQMYAAVLGDYGRRDC